MTTTPNLDTLVLGGSIESQLHDGHYVVEIFPDSGVVYAVWYWEDDDDFDYSNAYTTVNPDKSDRLKNGNMVGYYGGPGFDSNVERLKLKQTPIPSLQVTNAEELLLTITVPKPSGATPLSIKATVTLSSGGIEHKIVNGVNLFDDGGSGNYMGKIALDTFKNYINRGNANFDADGMGQQFKDWVDGSTINPGDNFDIEVKVEAEETGKEYLPQRVYWRDVNSLFADVETDPATGDPVTAHIAYGRHLQNLNKDISGVTDTITAAEQTRNIDFDATGVSDIYSWAKTYPGKTFTPIKNDKLTSYDGANRAISELVIDKTGENDVGLFGVTDAELDSIRLVNAKVSGKDNVGALAGQYNGSTITNCGAYVDDVSKPAAVTGSAYDTYKVTGTGNYVGGLVGNITSAAALSQSFASVKVTGATDVGGLVGQVNSNSTFTDCYSGGHTVDGTYKSDANVTGTGTTGVGGLVGAVADGNSLTLNKINYSTCSVKTSGSASETGLLVGTHTGATGTVAKGSDFERAYATGEAFDSTGAKITTGLHNETAYLDTDRGTNTVSDFITVPYDETLKTSVYPYATNLNMHYGDWLEEASASSLCYYEGYVGGTYGVWGYIVDTAGGTTPTLTNGLVPGTSGTYATDDGYCIPVEQIGGTSTAPAAPTVDGVTGISIETTPIGTYTDSTTSKTYDLYKVNGLDGVDKTSFYNKITVGSTEYWFNPFFACEVQKDEPTDKNIPGAKEGAAGVGSTLTGNYNDQVVIRTARQLVWLGELTQDIDVSSSSNPTANNDSKVFYYDYQQLLDIDYSQYNSDAYESTFSGRSNNDGTLQLPINLIKQDHPEMTGSYHGNTFLIKHMNIVSNLERVGLFARTKGEINGVRLVNVSVSSTCTTTGTSVGGLAGEAMSGSGSKIIDCGIYLVPETGMDMEDIYSTYYVGNRNTTLADNACVGGLIGNVGNGVNLQNCFAAMQVVGTKDVGGLAGFAKSNSKFINCYSGGHTVGGQYTVPNVYSTRNDTSNVGGLVGNVDNASVTFEGTCYSTCSVGVYIVKDGDTTLGALYAGSKTPTTTSATIYAVGKAFKADGANWTETKFITDNGLTSPSGNTQSDFKTHAYDGTLTGDYPYETKLSAHYGDWPVAKIEACFYWAKEGSGYEVYVLGFETGGTTATPLSPISTLCVTHHSVTDAMGANATSNSNNDWGYGTIGLTGTLSGTGVTDISATAPTDLTTALKEALKAYSFEDTDVKVYTGATEGGTVTNITSVADPGQTYHLNLGFAAAISLDNSLGSSGTPYQIRNVRQLDNIPDKDNHSYQQTHDVYGGGYTSDYTGASNFGGEWSWDPVGTYDGQSYRILELNMTSGLFTSISGYANLDNIILYSPSGNATVTGSGATGGLAGSVTGYGDTRITNCVVAGYTMSNMNYLGGLVGEVNKQNNRGYYLYITNSEAVNKLTYTGGGSYGAGGVVGHVAGGSVNITNTYAGGEISGSSYFGGIVGNANGTNGAVIYTNVYSYMKIVAGTKYGIGPVGYSTGYYQNCYYWQGGLSGYVHGGGSSGVTAATLDQLKTCISGANIGTADADHTFIPQGASVSGAYPYPAVVQGYTDGTEGSPTTSKVYVHYGDWN